MGRAIAALLIAATAASFFTAPRASAAESQGDGRGNAYDHPGDPHYVLKEITLRGYHYFVDGTTDNRLTIRPVSREEAIAEKQPLPAPGLCNLRTNIAISQSADRFDFSLGFEEQKSWKDRRGYLHSLDFLARQVRYNKWNRSSGTHAPPIPLSGILDSRTLWSESEIMHHQLDQAEENLKFMKLREDLPEVCPDVDRGFICRATQGSNPDIPKARIFLDAARNRLEVYDRALKSVPFMTPKPIGFPVEVVNGADGKKHPNRKYYRYTDGIGFRFNGTDCHPSIPDDSATAPQDEDGVTAEVDVLHFGPNQDQALAVLADDPQSWLRQAGDHVDLTSMDPDQ